MHRILSGLKKPFLFWCIMYALTTLASSIIQLLNNRPTDTNFHIINRAVIVLIGTIILVCSNRIKIKNIVVSAVIVYIISMAIIYTYVWATGFIEPLHPNAYRDITFNFTPLFIVITFIDWIKTKKAGNLKK